MLDHSNIGASSWTPFLISSLFTSRSNFFRFHGFKSYLYADSIYVSSPYLASELQKHLFNCQLNISTWVFHKHLQLLTLEINVYIATTTNTLNLFFLQSFSFSEMTPPYIQLCNPENLPLYCQHIYLILHHVLCVLGGCLPSTHR